MAVTSELTVEEIGVTIGRTDGGISMARDFSGGASSWSKMERFLLRVSGMFTT